MPHKGSFFEGRQLFSLCYTCDDCGMQILIFLGPGVDFPVGQRLYERMVTAEDTHVCPPKPVNEDDGFDVIRMPY